MVDTTDITYGQLAVCQNPGVALTVTVFPDPAALATMQEDKCKALVPVSVHWNFGYLYNIGITMSDGSYKQGAFEKCTQ